MFSVPNPEKKQEKALLSDLTILKVKTLFYDVSESAVFGITGVGGHARRDVFIEE